MSKPLTIGSFNLDNLDADEIRFASRLTALAPALGWLDADILCLQEVNADRVDGGRRLVALDRLLEGTPYAQFHRIATTSPSGHGPFDVHNLVILSRFPLLAFRQIHHQLVPPILLPSPSGSAVPAAIVEWDRPFLAAAVSLESTPPIWVVNLHLRAPIPAYVEGGKKDGRWRSNALWAQGFFRAAVKRVGQALETRMFIDELFDGDAGALIAVCGDFNAEGAEMPLRMIRADPVDADAPELAPRRLIALEEPEPEPTALHRGRPMRPDHVLASPALARLHLRTEVRRERLIDDESEPPPAGSTHRPLRALFSIDSR
jgi:endonuclease/exonuclease/phosphatase family metal-dependent hydrolase